MFNAYQQKYMTDRAQGVIDTPLEHIICTSCTGAGEAEVLDQHDEVVGYMPCYDCHGLGVRNDH